MKTCPLCLASAMDLRIALQDAVARCKVRAAFVMAGAASLSRASVRTAGATEPALVHGELEIPGLAGAVAGNGALLI